MRKHNWKKLKDIVAGFDWGGVRVQRLFCDKRLGAGLQIMAYREGVDVYISPTGKVIIGRFYKKKKGKMIEDIERVK